MTASRRAYRPRISTEDAIACCALAEPGVDAFLDGMVDDAEILIPNPPVDIVEWAFENIVLPFSVSPERPGALEFSPVQAGIIRLTQSSSLKQVTFKKPPRFGSSLMSVVIILYNAFHEGRSIIYYERSEDTAQALHDKFLIPIIENSPKLAPLMRPKTKAGVQDAWSDIILTNGGIIQLRSASNNGHMRSIKGNPVLADEVSSKEWRDRSKNAKRTIDSKKANNGEGSKVRLLRARLQQSARPMLYVGSTPTNEGDCIVSDEYEASDQRVYRMPCARCAKPIVFEASPAHFAKVDTRLSRRGPGLRYTVNDLGRPNDAWYECECGGLIEATEKIDMMAAGGFEITNPLGEDDHAGVYANALYSTDPQSEWLLLAKEHMAAVANPSELMQGFVNLVCALAFSPAPERVSDPSSLAAKVETWRRKDGTKADAPAWTRMIVKGIDVQKGSQDDITRPSRFEVTTVAIGTNRRRAVIDHVVLSHEEYVDQITGEIIRHPIDAFLDARSDDALWDEVGRSYATEDGREMRARRTFLDVSWRTDEALKFAAKPQSRQLNIIPIRGSTIERNGERVAILPNNLRLPKGRQPGRKYLFIGAQSVKDRVSRLLQIPAGYSDGYVFADHLDDAYFAGLVAEYPAEIRPHAFHWSRISSRNTGEPWDCMIYAYAAERYEIAMMGKKSKLAQEIDGIDPDVKAREMSELVAATVLPEPVSDVASDDEPPEDAPETPVEGLRGTVPPDDDSGEAAGGVRFRVVRRKVRADPEVGADGLTDRVRRVRARRTGLGW